jgi:hypothetical protein
MPEFVTTQTDSWLDPSRLDPQCELPEALRRAELDPTIEAAVVALGVALDDAAAFDARGLARRIRTDPARSLFQSVLAQLGSERLLRMLDWLTDPSEPNRRAILVSLFTPKEGDCSDAIRRAVRVSSKRALFNSMHAETRLRFLAFCATERLRDKTTRRKLQR